MHKIKHVSFDVWGTLVTANPKFAVARREMLSRILHKKEAEIQSAYSETKYEVDSAAIRYGSAISTDRVIARMFEMLHLNPSEEAISQVRQSIEELFRAYPPLVSPDAVKLISTLKWLTVSSSIGSNSNFISGDVMYPFLKRAGLQLEYGVFSDLELCAKPSFDFFAKVAQEAAKLRIAPHEILHVGDNATCDGAGPQRFGMQFAIVDRPEDISVAVRSRFDRSFF